MQIFWQGVFALSAKGAQWHSFCRGLHLLWRRESRLTKIFDNDDLLLKLCICISLFRSITLLNKKIEKKILFLCFYEFFGYKKPLIVLNV